MRTYPSSPSVLAIALALCPALALGQTPARAVAASPPRAASLPVLHVTVRTGAIDAPESVPGDWTRLHVVKKEGPHIVVVFRLREGASAAALVAALDTARATPTTATALSGLEIERDGELVISLTPGRYVLACMRRGADGKRHVSAGETRELVVTPNRAIRKAAVTPPRATAEVRMVDFAYPGAARWRAGPSWVRVTNDGKEDHLVMIARLHDGTTLRDWAGAKDQSAVSTPITGAARMSAGTTAYLPTALQPGRYVLYCMIPHAASGKPHVMLGMFKEITVE